MYISCRPSLLRVPACLLRQVTGMLCSPRGDRCGGRRSPRLPGGPARWRAPVAGPGPRRGGRGGPPCRGRPQAPRKPRFHLRRRGGPDALLAGGRSMRLALLAVWLLPAEHLRTFLCLTNEAMQCLLCQFIRPRVPFLAQAMLVLSSFRFYSVP